MHWQTVNSAPVAHVLLQLINRCSLWLGRKWISKCTNDHQILSRWSLFHEVHSLDSQCIFLQWLNLWAFQTPSVGLLVNCQHSSKEHSCPMSAGTVLPQNVSDVRKVLLLWPHRVCRVWSNLLSQDLTQCSCTAQTVLECSRIGLQETFMYLYFPYSSSAIRTILSQVITH